MTEDMKPEQRKGPSPKRGAALALTAGLLWGFSGSCAQFLFATYQTDSLWLTSIRMFVAGAILIIVCLCGRNLRGNLIAMVSNKRDLIQLLLFGIAGLGFCQMAYLLAINYTNAGTATVLQYVGPVLVVIYVCVSERTKPSKRLVIAVISVVIGVFLISTNGNPFAMVLTNEGLFWGLMSAVAVAIYSLIPRRIMARYGSVPVMAGGCLVGGTLLSLYTQPWTTDYGLDAFGWLALLGGLTIIGTTIAFTLYLQAINEIGASKTSLLASFETVSATCFAAFWLGTPFTPMTLIGFVFIIATVFILHERD